MSSSYLPDNVDFEPVLEFRGSGGFYESGKRHLHGFFFTMPYLADRRDLNGSFVLSKIKISDTAFSGSVSNLLQNYNLKRFLDKNTMSEGQFFLKYTKT